MKSDKPVVILTGAAGAIGAATAARLASSGYRLVLVDLDLAALESLSNTQKVLCEESFLLAGDLTDLDFVQSIVQQTMAHWGRIDAVINNAAWREMTSMRRLTPESWDRTLRVCLTAPAFLSRWSAEHMQGNNGGVILNVSSCMSNQAAGISPAYIAAKGGLDSLTYELASLYGPLGIRVIAVNPGAVKTLLSWDVSQDSSGKDSLELFCNDMIMLGRYAESDEVANVIAFLLSNEASYITGTTITVDGGWTRQHLPLSLKKQHFPSDYL